MSKRILLLSAALALSCFAAFAQDPEPEPTGPTVWIHELPGVMDANGLRVAMASPIVNQTARKQLVITTAGRSRLVSLMRQGQILPRLRVVAGKYKGQAETEYTLANVRVQSVNASGIVLGYDRIETRMAVKFNPGPPPGASVGTMFIYGVGAQAIALPMRDFDAPPGEGVIRVRLQTVEVPQRLQDLIARGVWSGQLILVLPLKSGYVEYKLAAGDVSQSQRELRFRAPEIVILTGR